MSDDFLDRVLGDHEPPQPEVAARRGARRALPKRFWRVTSVVPADGGFAVALDGKIARTPLRHVLAVPTEALAAMLAAEWDAQANEIDPALMPLTRLANAAIDAVASGPEPVAAEIVKYAGSDLLCYREASNERLVARQAALWDPPLAWAREALGARFVLAASVSFTPQPAETVAAIEQAVARLPVPFGLAAAHSATTLTSSAVLALALASGALSADVAWAAAHVDEDFQIEVWGADEEAATRRAARRREFDAAVLVLEQEREDG